MGKFTCWGNRYLKNRLKDIVAIIYISKNVNEINVCELLDNFLQKPPYLF